MEGYTYGLELDADWQATDWQRLVFMYSYLQTRMQLTGESTDIDSKLKTEGSSPRHQFSLRSSTDIMKKFEFDVWLRYVDELSARDIDSYITMDARAAWRLFKNFEVSVTGQNLLDRYHREFSGLEVERSVYFKIDWRF